MLGLHFFRKLFGLPRISVWLSWERHNGDIATKEFRLAHGTTLNDFYRYRVPYAVSGVMEVWRNKELVLTLMMWWGTVDKRKDILEDGDHLIFLATESSPKESKGPL